jgi:hypothetical protein
MMAGALRCAAPFASLLWLACSAPIRSDPASAPPGGETGGGAPPEGQQRYRPRAAGPNAGETSGAPAGVAPAGPHPQRVAD